MSKDGLSLTYYQSELHYLCAFFCDRALEGTLVSNHTAAHSIDIAVEVEKPISSFIGYFYFVN